MRIVPGHGDAEGTDTRKGRGGFAARAFAAGKIVEMPGDPLRRGASSLPAELRRVIDDRGFLS
jgi:hypothetical protein